MTSDLYSSIFIRYYISSIHFVIELPLSIVHEKNLSFFIISSFVLCDTVSGCLGRPNNSDSIRNISHCCH